MKTHEIRSTFLDYFKKREHLILPSSSVVPHGDPTLLFTNAGMNQFKDYFTQKKKPEAPRASTVQKCIRAGGKHNDLDNVGYTARHLTFFEMLGNFSFGDYFKEDAIKFGWELLVDGFGLNPDDLWITVYKDDDEAREIWIDHIGVRPERVVGLGEKDNYWSMGDVGPCGPCSEIHLDRGPEHDDGSGLPIGENESDRYFEIWNLVFMQYDQQPGGKKVPLAKPCIDTGMGVERLAMVLQGVDSVFETDVLRALTSKISDITGKAYDSSSSECTPHRVIADHIRSLVFAFADGAEPSNEGGGYVLRRILRRAARYGRKLQTSDEPLLCQLVDTVMKEMGEAYPEILDRRSYIENVIQNEEERFGKTLDKGIHLFEGLANKLEESGTDTVSGKDAFELYDTYGFPFDLTQQMAQERGLSVDEKGFEENLEQAKQISREGSQFSVHAGADDGLGLELSKFPETTFLGYDSSVSEAEIIGLASQDDSFFIVLDQSPFYAESGGQVGDVGTLAGEGFVLAVEDTKKDQNRWIHRARLVEGDAGSIVQGAVVEAVIDGARREAIERNHTATHLLHAALREIVGDHVHQKGSLVEAARLRFDVTHFSGITLEERQKAEELVLREIANNTPVETFETDYDDAIKKGAMALFGEKYGDVVRVVKIGDFSTELCGGTHVARTGDIGPFVITQEGSVSSGVRRLEGITEIEASRYHHQQSRMIDEIAQLLRAPVDQIPQRIQKLQDENRKLRSGQGKKKAAVSSDLNVETKVLGEGDNAISCHGAVIKEGGRAQALALYDQLKSKNKRGIFILLAPEGKKLAAIVAVSPPLVKEGWSAKDIFESGKEPIEGRGGGRPEMVQGGGGRPEGADDALKAMWAFLDK